MNSSVGHTVHIPNLLDNYTPQTIYIDTAAYSLNLLVGFPVNFYILWLIATGAGGSVAAEFFNLNLTLSDTIYCLSGIVVFLDFYVFNGTIYMVRAFFTGFICLTRPLFQCCICVERYLAVVHPVLFMKFKPLRYRVALSGLVWLMVVSCCVVGLLLSFPTVMFLFYMAQYVLVFIVKSYCCLAVMRVLKQPGPGDGDKDGANSMKQKAFSIIRVIIIAHVLTLLAIGIIMPLQTKLPLPQYFFALSICLSIVVIVGFIQPVLYIRRSGRLPCGSKM